MRFIALLSLSFLISAGPIDEEILVNMMKSSATSISQSARPGENFGRSGLSLVQPLRSSKGRPGIVVEDIIPFQAVAKLSPTVKKKASIILDYDKEFVLQGEFGSCHSFASAELVYVATGLKLSLATLFMDHLVSPLRYGPNANEEVFKLNEASINENRVPNNNPRLCKYISSWEFGRLNENLQLLQTRGGMVVPQNTEWKEVERIMSNIGTERIRQASSAIPTIDGRQRLSEAGIGEIIQRSLAAETMESRKVVMAATKGLSVAEILIEKKSPDVVISEIVEALPNGPIYMGVNVLVFYKLLNGIKLAETVEHPLFSGHSVVVVGYSASLDQFLIKDSNKLAILQMDAHDLISVSKTAFHLVRK